MKKMITFLCLLSSFHAHGVQNGYIMEGQAVSDVQYDRFNHIFLDDGRRIHLYEIPLAAIILEFGQMPDTRKPIAPEEKSYIIHKHNCYQQYQLGENKVGQEELLSIYHQYILQRKEIERKQRESVDLSVQTKAECYLNIEDFQNHFKIFNKAAIEDSIYAQELTEAEKSLKHSSLVGSWLLRHSRTNTEELKYQGREYYTVSMLTSINTVHHLRILHHFGHGWTAGLLNNKIQWFPSLVSILETIKIKNHSLKYSLHNSEYISF